MTEQLLAGRYLLHECLGTGGTGNVYRATQLPTRRAVALKLLRPELGKKAVFRRRFAREARAAASLTHPNVCAVFDFGAAEGDALYLAMELVEGASLREVIEEGLHTVPALELVEQVLSGLAHAHARGLVHRDLKPANILVARQGDELIPKIVDFGIASTSADDEDEDNHHGKVVGTPAYMSPEQAQGERHLGPPTDLYNVGLMLYELATGRHPFTARTAHEMMLAHCTETVPRPLPRPGFFLPTILESVILRCLEKDPAARYPSAAACRSALAAARQAVAAQGPRGFPPVAPVVRREGGRATLVEGTPRVNLAVGANVISAAAPPLVGRDAERRLLSELCVRVGQGEHGAAVVLEGEAGIGKTRLATWLRERQVESGAMQAASGSFPREGGTSLEALRQALEELFQTRGLGIGEASQRVVSRMAAWELLDAPAAGLLIELMRHSAPGSADRPQRRSDDERVFAAVTRTLRAASRVRPLLLVLDDLHWAGDPMAAFLEHLVGCLDTGLRVVLVCTLRSGELPPESRLARTVERLSVEAHDRFLRRRIRALPDEQTRALIDAVLPADPSLAETVAERSGGNPLFTLQILRYLGERGLLQSSPEGGYRAAQATAVNEVVPPNLEELIRLRLERLAEQDAPNRPLARVLQCAAILGARFHPDVLEAMLREPPSVSEWDFEATIEQLLDEAVLRHAGGASGEPHLAFTHGLFRDVVLRGLRSAPRRELHQSAARAKLAFHADTPEVVAHQVALHFARAERWEDALRYAHIAAEAAERTHRPLDAATAWDTFADLRERSAAADDGLPSRDEALARSGEIREALGDYDDALAVFARILPGPGVPLSTAPRIRAAIGQAAIALKRGKAERARTRYDQALTAARHFAPGRLASAALLGLARVAAHRGESDTATELAKRALAQAKDAGDRAAQADALWFAGDTARLEGDLPTAVAHFRSALQHFRAADRPGGAARCLYGLALVSRGLGHYDRAETLYREALEALERLGIRRGIGHCLNGLGEVARFRDDLGAARGYYLRAFEVFERAGLPQDAAISLTNLGLVARDEGDRQGARDAFERALRLAEATEWQFLKHAVALNLAWLLLLEGERAEARRLLDEHLDAALESHFVDPDVALPLEGIGQLLEGEGGVDEARAERLFAHAAVMWQELKREREARRVQALIGS
jgi:tetratricopeptide (TPR) repeat protein